MLTNELSRLSSTLLLTESMKITGVEASYLNIVTLILFEVSKTFIQGTKKIFILFQKIIVLTNTIKGLSIIISEKKYYYIKSEEALVFSVYIFFN